MKKPTYTATFDDNGEVIFEHRNRGTRYDLFPKGSQMKSFTETGDGWNGAHGVTPSGRAFTVRRDNAQQPISAPCKPVASVSGAGTGKEALVALPWSVRPTDTPLETRENCIEPLWIADANGAAVLAVTSGGHARATAREREISALIVRACNSHAALLRGCQAALAYLADPPSEFAENRAAAVELIRAALAAATESEGA